MSSRLHTALIITVAVILGVVAFAPVGASGNGVSVPTLDQFHALEERVTVLEDGSTTTTTTPPDGWAEGSNPPTWEQPYATTSIWKRRIDTSAPRTPAGTAGMRTTDGWSAAAPLEAIHFYDLTAGRNINVRRFDRASAFGDKCGNRGSFVENIKLPDGWNTRSHVADGGRNNQINVHLGNGDLRYYQASQACSSSELVAADPGSFTHGTLDGDGLEGARGAARFANGGVLRAPDLSGPINHALELSADQKYLSPLDGGYRWPALAADGGYNDPSKGSHYQGAVPEMTMGSLVALPADWDLDANGITNPLMRKIATALKTYGGYIGDVTAWKNSSAWSVAVDSAHFDDVWANAGWYRDRSQWFTMVEAFEVVDTSNHPENR